MQHYLTQRILTWAQKSLKAEAIRGVALAVFVEVAYDAFPPISSPNINR